MNRTLAGALMLASALTPMAGHTQGTPPVDLSYGVTAPATGLPRTLSARDSDVYNVLDFGALGDGTGAMIGTTYGPNLTPEKLALVQAPNGSLPFAWATDAKAGLRFPITSSAASAASTYEGATTSAAANEAAATTIEFAEHAVSGMGWTASTVALWQDPRFGNLLVSIGLVVTLDPSNTTTCSAPPPAGTTILMVGRDPYNSVNAVPYGSVQVSNTFNCPSGTVFRLEIASADLMALTQDWLGIQAAEAQASLYAHGGDVFAPAGSGGYVLNHASLNMQDKDNSYVMRFRGAEGTTISWKNDLGRDMSGFKTVDRDQNPASQAFFTDLILKGPGANNPTPGVRPDGMDGIDITNGGYLANMTISGFVDAVNGANDHFSLLNVHANGNGCGWYQSAYTQALGNQSVEQGALGGNYVASICIDSTNSVDSAYLSHFHTGYGPIVYYKLPHPPNVTSINKGILTNDILDAVYTEQAANYWVYDPDKMSGVNGNSIIGGGGASVGAAAPSTPVSTTIGHGFALLGDFGSNTMIGTSWYPYPNMPANTALIVANSCENNSWTGDIGFVQLATASNNQLNCPVNTSNNTFSFGGGRGSIRQVSSIVKAGQPLYYGGYYGQVAPYLDGRPMAGMAATSANSPANGVTSTVAVYESYDEVVLPGGSLFAIKADPTQVINLGDPLIPTSTPSVGFTKGATQVGAAGSADRPSSVNDKILGMILNPIAGAGATGIAAAASAIPAMLPSSLPGLAAWYESGKITGLADGAAVSNWPDLSGNKANATFAAGATNDPIYASSRTTYTLPNNTPVVAFDGNIPSSLSTPISASGPQSVCITANVTGSGTQGMLDVSAAGGLYFFLVNHTLLQIYNGNAIASVAVAANDGQPHVFCETYSNVAGGPWSMWMDAKKAGAGTVSVILSGDSNAVFASNSLTTSATMTVTSATFYSAVLTDTQMIGLQNYLMTAPGIPH